MNRYLIWLLAAVVAIGAFAIGRLLSLPQGVVLLVTFIGAMVGTAIATWLVQHLLEGGVAPEPKQSTKKRPPTSPRSRGSGRKAR